MKITKNIISGIIVMVLIVSMVSAQMNVEPHRGDKNAEVKMVGYMGYNDQFSQQLWGTMKEIIEDYDVSYEFRNYPYSFHESSFELAQAGECVFLLGGEDIFFDYTDELYDRSSVGVLPITVDVAKATAKSRGVDINTCLSQKWFKEEVENDIYSADLQFLRGTPSVYINGEQITGAQGYDVYAERIEEIQSEGNSCSDVRGVKSSIQEGGTKTFDIYGTDYEVTVLYVSDSGNKVAKLMINGEVTPSMGACESYEVSGGALITLTSIASGNPGIVEVSVNGNDVCVTEDPVVTISNSRQQGSIGDTKIYIFNIKNANSQGCAFSETYSLDFNPKPSNTNNVQWDTSLSKNKVTLTSGSSASVQASLTPRGSDTTSGTYTFGVGALKGSTGFDKATAEYELISGTSSCVVSGDVQVTLREGAVKTYSINGVEYEVKVVYVSDSGTPQVKLMINGFTTPAMKSCETHEIIMGSDTVSITPTSIFTSNPGNVAFSMKATRETTPNSCEYSGGLTATLREGETKTYTIDGMEYEITLGYVSDSGTPQAKFSVNGFYIDSQIVCEDESIATSAYRNFFIRPVSIATSNPGTVTFSMNVDNYSPQVDESEYVFITANYPSESDIRLGNMIENEFIPQFQHNVNSKLNRDISAFELNNDLGIFVHDGKVLLIVGYRAPTSIVSTAIKIQQYLQEDNIVVVTVLNENIKNKDFSKAFPKVQVVSPNGREVFKHDETYKIEWSTENAPVGSYVGTISVETSDGSWAHQVVPFLSRQPSTGSVDWTVPYNAPEASNYIVKVVLNIDEQSGVHRILSQDESDGSFAILTNTYLDEYECQPETCQSDRHCSDNDLIVEETCTYYILKGDDCVAKEYTRAKAFPNGCADENEGTIEQPTSNSCDGCMRDGRCVPISTRVSNGDARYCSIEGEFSLQLEDGASCQNNYECVSNQCLNAQCKSLEKELEETRGMMERILAWLDKLF